MLNPLNYDRSMCISDEEYTDWQELLSEAVSLGCDYEYLTDWVDNTIMWTRFDTVLKSDNILYERFCRLYNEYNKKYC